MTGADLSRQQAALQRTICQDCLAMADAIRHQLVFYFTSHHAIGHLVRCQPDRFFRLLHLRRIIIADTGRPDLPIPDQLSQRLHRFRNRRGDIRPMLLIQVDIVCPQTPETVLTLFYHTFLAAVLIDVQWNPRIVLAPECKIAARHIPSHAELRHDLHFLSGDALQRLSDDLFAQPHSINRGSIYRCHSFVIGGLDSGDGVFTVTASPQPTADRPGAERDRRGLDTRLAEFSVFHKSLFKQQSYGRANTFTPDEYVASGFTLSTPPAGTSIRS